MTRTSTWLVTLGAGLLAGAVATAAKTKAEALLQPQAERIWPPAPAAKATVVGADPADHPANMPPAVVVGMAAHAAGRQADDDAKESGSDVLHRVMGVGSAVAYAVLAREVPAVRAGFGAPAGLALYAATHGSTLPALGLQPYPWQMPRAAVAWEAGSHVVYGVVADGVLRVVDVLRRRR